MRIVFIEIENFRGIKSLRWAPSARVNCLIGPGDSTKTTILDAIELALNPRSYQFADDSDFYDLNSDVPIKITVTLADLPVAFKADDRYGLHLRGWDDTGKALVDEPKPSLEDALSLRVTIASSLEARWSIFNDRIGDDNEDPPSVRYKDAQSMSTTRLGPYAERHFAWGRQSVLNRIGEAKENVSLQLAQASRAARDAFRKQNPDVFKETASRAEALGKQFAVPVRTKYAAELDVQGVSITSGGIALHDGKLPLRRLGTGSARLIVSALQHDAGGSHIALIDEIEHGLEPHRIARLLKYLKSPPEGDETVPAQIFMTTHSLVAIRESAAEDLMAVRCDGGITKVLSVAETAKALDVAERHMRSSPDAFLARKIIVGEGRTEHGLLRGLDACWTHGGQESFALRGTTAIDGNGNSNALVITEHLVDLGYEAFLILDTDQPVDQDIVARIKAKGGQVHEWPDVCCTEVRLFLDIPWAILVSLMKFTEDRVSADSVRATINNTCKTDGLSELSDLTFPVALDSPEFRRALGKTADEKSWYKSIPRAERVAEIIEPCLKEISGTPLAKTFAALRQWVDA
jgi:putative ATP-dependent endonuclease of OLD family